MQGLFCIKLVLLITFICVGCLPGQYAGSSVHKASSPSLSQWTAPAADGSKGSLTSSGRSQHHVSSPDKASLHYRMMLLARAVYLLFLFAPVVLLSVIAYFSSYFSSVVWFPILRLTVGHSGAAFIKWGQWASTRSDMFPEALCKELSKLQAQAPTHSFDFTRRQVELELGVNLFERFEMFESVPIASGSIAQVHRAVMDNQVVAVKVRHPNVKELISLDFDLLTMLARLSDVFPSTEWLKLKESLVQFADTIASQTSLDVEGEHLDQLNRNFRSSPDVNFPEPIVKTDSVLVESFFTGESVAKFIEVVDQDLPNNIELAHFIVTRGEDLYLQMLIKDNFMHADLHPGNILLSYTDHHHHQLPTYGVKRFDKHLTLALVDAGMVAVLTKEQRYNFIGLLEAIGEGDGMLAADCISKCSEQRLEPHAMRSFQQEVITLFSQIARGYGSNVDVGTVLRGVLQLIRKYRITIDANYATLVMNALCLDSMAKALVPSYNVIDAAKPLLQLFRLSKKIPRSIVDKLWDVSVNAMFWAKRRTDRHFLKKLKATPLSVIQEGYNKK